MAPARPGRVSPPPGVTGSLPGCPGRLPGGRDRRRFSGLFTERPVRQPSIAPARSASPAVRALPTSRGSLPSAPAAAPLLAGLDAG